MRRWTPMLVAVVVTATTVVACSGATTTIGGGDDGDAAGAGDGAAGSDATLDGGGGADGASGSDGAQGSDGTVAPDGGRVDAQISITEFFENCQPVVDPDPVQMKGTLSVKNNTSANIGPVTIPTGSYLEAGTFKVVATFKLEKTSVPVLGPGASATVPLVKMAGSLVPTNGALSGCRVLECGKQYIVEIDPIGPGVPTGVTLRTNPITINCTL